jgi:hypothetical protein
MATKRQPIYERTRDEVLREAGYKCANPTCRNIITLQIHHMLWVKEGGKSDANNLIALCGHCHDLHTQGHISKSAISYWKGMLHALNHAFNREGMDNLLFLAVPTMENIWYSGDAVLRFAGLIAAGLVEIAQSQQAVGLRWGNDPVPTAPPTTAVRLRLSEKGKLLVNSWKRGDEATYVQGLAQSGASSPQ